MTIWLAIMFSSPVYMSHIEQNILINQKSSSVTKINLYDGENFPVVSNEIASLINVDLLLQHIVPV